MSADWSTVERVPCRPCRDAEHEPQGDVVRLFEPAPAQLEGQLTL